MVEGYGVNGGRIWGEWWKDMGKSLKKMVVEK
jgi:hypothetical protein